MLNKNQIIRFITLGAVALSLSMTGCAAKKSTWGDPETGLILKYNIQQDQPLNYKRNSESEQSMEMMGQSMKTTTKTDSDYIIEGEGTDDQNNIKTRITINELTISANSPQGQISPDTSSLKGKSFGITFSPTGKEVEFTGIDDLPTISMGQPGAQPQSVKNFFSNLLLNLPDDSVKIGDTWITPIDTVRKQGPIDITFKGETTSVLEGLETIQGMDCVRIKSQAKSMVQGSGNMMGQDLKISGNTNTTATSYFAYKKGVFVKATADEDSSMKISMGSMGEMPQTTKGKTTVELVQ